jgi:hypothetical protein
MILVPTLAIFLGLIICAAGAMMMLVAAIEMDEDDPAVAPLALWGAFWSARGGTVLWAGCAI